MFVGNLVVKDIKFYDEDIFKLVLGKTDEIGEIKCGQFFNFKPDTVDGMILRRPISVGWQDENSITFYIKKVGKGTAWLANRKAGDTIDVMGPLGNGFNVESARGKNALMIGGGIGVAPLIELGKNLREAGASELIYSIGFNDSPYGRSKIDSITGKSFIYSRLSNDFLSGLPTDNLVEIVKSEKIDVIYTCGPDAMMEAIVKRISEEKLDVDVQVSLEERMGCGFGVCLCCSKIVKPQNSPYEHTVCVCKEGPVFSGKEVYGYE
jgi:dihydroorotate dehydrogenase electron transfer subunit